MAYFLLEMPVSWVWQPLQDTLQVEEDWLVSAQPGSCLVGIIAVQAHEDRVWKEPSYYKSLLVPHNAGPHKMFTNTNKAQELSEDEACLILFGLE